MELIGQGRDADVYALDASRVLRRYRDGGPVAAESRLMAYLADHGYPVPRVHDITPTDMIMERLAGPTMLEALTGRISRVPALSRSLAGLHARLHRIPAPEWLPPAFATTTDNRVLHLDLHPGNVLLTERGPVVIDWRNAAAGDPAADVAMTMVTVGSADLPQLAGPGGRLGRRWLVRALRTGSGSDPAPRVPAAARAKLADPNLSETEAAWLRRHAPRGG